MLVSVPVNCVLVASAVIGVAAVTIQLQAGCHVHPTFPAEADTRTKVNRPAGCRGGAPGHSRHADCRAGVCVGNGARGGACARPPGGGRIGFDRSSFTSLLARSEAHHDGEWSSVGGVRECNCVLFVWD